jgi:hypothetical protein
MKKNRLEDIGKQAVELQRLISQRSAFRKRDRGIAPTRRPNDHHRVAYQIVTARNTLGCATRRYIRRADELSKGGPR